MSTNDKPVPFTEAAMYAVNAIAEFCTELGKKGVPNELIVYALEVNHAMALRMILEASFAAAKAERSTSSESPQGG